MIHTCVFAWGEWGGLPHLSEAEPPFKGEEAQRAGGGWFVFSACCDAVRPDAKKAASAGRRLSMRYRQWLNRLKTGAAVTGADTGQ